LNEFPNEKINNTLDQPVRQAHIYIIMTLQN